MNTKKKLFITTVILAVLAIPTMAWALNGPFAADLDLPVIPGDEAAGETHGWMSDMHDYMWNNGELPEDFPADATWMNDMHDYMGSNHPTDGSYGSMSQMHDYMWNDGELPEGFPTDATWMNDMHDYMWGDTPTDGSYGSMSQMHDYMWNNGELPEGSAGSTHPMGGGMWGGR